MTTRRPANGESAGKAKECGHFFAAQGTANRGRHLQNWRCMPINRASLAQHQTVHRTGVMRWFYAGFDRFYGYCLGIQMRADGADCVNRFDSRNGWPPHLFGNEVIDRNMITARFHVEQYLSLHGRDFTIRVFERDKAAAKENILLPPHIHRIVAADFKRPVHPAGCGLQKSGHLGVLLLSLPAQQNGRGF